MSARQRSLGWQRLQQAATRAPVFNETQSLGWRVWKWRLRPVLAMAILAAIAIPVGWRFARTGEGRPLEFTVSGEDEMDARATTGRVLLSRTGKAELLFTDGSWVAMRQAARVVVSDLTAKGSNVRLLDGIVDADVRHRPDAAWTFQAGPHTVRVKGTSFELGWDAARKRLTLKMRSGVVALVSPPAGSSVLVKGGESVSVDEVGNRLALPAYDQESSEVPPTAATPSAANDVIGALGADPAKRGPESRLVRSLPSHSDWVTLLGRGDFDAIVHQAKKMGIETCLASDTEHNLAVLADAARYTHRNDLARRSLLTLRTRFPATDRARDAAFFLARLSEAASAAAAPEALAWYERYLEEAPRGSYAEEALGREMILLGRSGTNQARGVASRYLSAYPHGLYTGEASGLLRNPSIP
jgi:hypothetical protein